VGSKRRGRQCAPTSSATAALAHCNDLLAVRDLLGHASVATTQIYTAVVPGRTAAASRALTMPAA
jgi:site-specific recombinase XerD